MLGKDRCGCLCIQSGSSNVCGQDQECLVRCAGGSVGQVLNDLCFLSPEAPTPVVVEDKAKGHSCHSSGPGLAT